MKRLSREWVVQQVSTNSRGQRNIYVQQHIEKDMEEFFMAIDRTFGIVSDPEVPDSLLAKWMRKKCVTRKTREDWSGLRCMQRDFEAFAGEHWTPAAFESAIARAGFAIHHGMISRLILKSDLQMTISEVYGDMLIQ